MLEECVPPYVDCTNTEVGTARQWALVDRLETLRRGSPGEVIGRAARIWPEKGCWERKGSSKVL